MSSISLSGPSAYLSYVASGENHVARLRCSDVSITYGLNSTESDARAQRAFYPHRRSQGTFDLTFDCNRWSEFNLVIAWFSDYAKTLLDQNTSATPPPMSIQIPSRNFSRLGIPTTGMQSGDYIGSMVFSPVISFISVHDANDATTDILNTNQVSGMVAKNGSLEQVYFYPDSLANAPGKLGESIFDGVQNVVTTLSASILQGLVNSADTGTIDPSLEIGTGGVHTVANKGQAN